MSFRTECRFLGGITELNDGQHPQRVCALTSTLIIDCDGCNTFKSVHDPCEICTIFQVCKNQTSRREGGFGPFGEIMEDFDDSKAPHPPMIPRQVYSGQMPDPGELMTPIPAVIDGPRHLIYHIWPKGVWRWNVERLLKRIDLFDGVRTVGIVVGKDSATLQQVKDAFAGHPIDNWIVKQNRPHRGESATFREMLATLPIDGVTFYGHAKGVKHNPPNAAVRIWTDLMHRFCLDDWATVETVLSQFPMAGCLRQHFHVAKPFGCHRWHYAGTHFWFRNKDVFERPEWKELKDGYYSTEVWPGRLFKRSEAACLFAEDTDNSSSFGDLYTFDAMARYREMAGIPLPSISIVIPTLGRDSLRNVVDSLKRQIGPKDELVVVADGHEAAERSSRITDCFEHHDPASKFGNAQRRFGQQLARGDLVWFVDDDDKPDENAVKTIKATFTDRPVIFRMDHCGEPIWVDKNATMGNVGTPMIVVPNRPGIPLFPANDVYSADNQWINEVISAVGVEWCEDVIYSVERHSVGATGEFWRTNSD